MIESTFTGKPIYLCLSIYGHLSIKVIVSVQSLSIHQVYYNDNNINFTSSVFFTCSFRYLRMSPDRFEHLVNLVGPFIAKQDTSNNCTRTSSAYTALLSYRRLSAVSVFQLLHWTCYCLSYHK